MGVLTKIRGRKSAEEKKSDVEPEVLQPTKPPAPPLAPPIPCLVCDCPAVWLSIYDDLGEPVANAPAARCCLCDPPPAWSMIRSRWLLVLDRDDAGRECFVWEEFPRVDYRRLDFTPRDALQPHGGPSGAGEATDGGDWPAVAAGSATGSADDSDTTYPDTNLQLAYDRRKRSPAELYPGTLIDYRTPAVFSLGEGWDDGSMLTQFVSGPAGWNDLVRLTARLGFDKAWSVLSERTERIFARM